MEDSRLANLMTYTVFHIGVYVSLFTALIGVGIFGKLDHPILRFAVGCFFVAGVAGAVVGSNIPEHPDFSSFAGTPLGPWGIPLFSYWWWTIIEHGAFWLGILPIVGGFLLWGPKAFGPG
jgi:hypothetical protein